MIILWDYLLVNIYLNLHKRYNQTLKYIDLQKQLASFDGPLIDVIAPNKHAKEVKPHEQNSLKLHAGAVSGFVGARDFFGYPHINENTLLPVL